MSEITVVAWKLQGPTDAATFSSIKKNNTMAFFFSFLVQIIIEDRIN